ncbi:DHA2 family efflux MFS transporter permease subunit [Siminovitchia sediminis]|uniref:DHA2 family efflux MFS transporter permease subunit n=1 Tax=Siminovitchia sediminis TaxID=1274353 RepID=A0ABW4KLY5_9BACI
MSTIATKQEKQIIRKTLILISFLIAAFIGLFSETALNMALRDLTQIFNVSYPTVQWLTTGYLLTLGMLVPISGFLIQWFTTRQLFIASLVFSIVGTLVAALAPSFGILLLARVIQAIGTSLILPLMFNTILLIYPVEKRGAIMGIVGLVIMCGPAIGPTMSGLFIEYLSWRWIFWACLPLLIISILLGIKYMANVSETTKPKLDVLSIILSIIGFGGIVYGFSNAGEYGWASTLVISTITIGIVALVIFSIRQFKLDQPMLDLHVFKYPMFTLGILSLIIIFLIQMSSLILLPLYLQTGLVLTAFSAGFVLLPGGVLNGILSLLSGRIFDKYGPRVLIIPGFIILIVTLWNLSNVTTETSIIMVIIMHASVQIAGGSMVFIAAQTNGLNQLPQNLYPDGSALMNTLQQVSGSIGTALAITIMSASQNTYLKSVKDPLDPAAIRVSLTAGIQDAFLFSIILAIAGLIIAIFIKSSRDR